MIIKLIRLLRELAMDGWRAAVRLLAILGSYCRSRQPKIVKVIEGNVDLYAATRVAVYAHYDANGQVHNYVSKQVSCLADAGYCVIFVTNSNDLDAESIAQLTPHVSKIVCRKNIGYDFGAYKDGIHLIPAPGALDSLIIANDSVYGPFHMMDEILSSEKMKSADAIAITDSWEIRYHLQSYFMVFSKATLHRSEFWQFWADLRYINNKGAVVRRYEVGLTNLLLKLRLGCTALYPYQVAAKMMYDELGCVDLESKTFRARPQQEQAYVETLVGSLSAGIPLNGSHFLWEKLLLEMGCPFVKRELLAVNPMKVPNLIQFEESLKNVSDYDFELIRDHLKIVSRMKFL